jgi:hypothetical protein
MWGCLIGAILLLFFFVREKKKDDVRQRRARIADRVPHMHRGNNAIVHVRCHAVRA